MLYTLARTFVPTKFLDHWRVRTFNFPRLLDWLATVLEPEGAPVAHRGIESIVVEEVL